MEFELEPKFDSRKSFYKKALVRHEGNKMILKSYFTDVAQFENGKFKAFGTYSPTTLRHIKEFAKQGGIEIKTKKDLMKYL